MEPKTKREAEEARKSLLRAHQDEQVARWRVEHALLAGDTKATQDAEQSLLTEAARLRAMLPTLPD